MTRPVGRLSRPIQIGAALVLALSFGIGARQSNIAHAAGKYYLVTSAACPATYMGHPITACSTTITASALLAHADGDGDTIYVVAGTYTENVPAYSNDTFIGPMDGIPGWCSSANPALINPNALGSSTLCGPAAGYRQRNNPAVEAVVVGGFDEGVGVVVRGFDIEGGLSGPYVGTNGEGVDIWPDHLDTTSYNILGASPSAGYLCGFGGGSDSLTYNLFEANLEAFSNFPPHGGSYTCSNTSLVHNWFDSNANTGVWLPSYTGTGTNDSATFNQFTNNARGVCLCGFGTGVYAGTLTAEFNRYYNNNGGGEVQNSSGAAALLDTSNSWWGCNTGSNTAGCDAAVNTPPGTQLATPYLKLNVHARAGYPSTLPYGGSTQADADMTQTCDQPPNPLGSCSSGGYVANGTPVHWTFVGGVPSIVFCGTGAAAGGATADSVTVSGHGYIQICGFAPGTVSVCGTVDNATKCYTVTFITPVSTPTGTNVPYVSANSLSPNTNYYVSFVARYRSYAPISYRGDLDYRDFLTPFFINAYGSTGFSTSPGINAPRSSYCSSYAPYRPYCQLTIDAMVCPGVGYGAQVYGHYTVNSTNYYWVANVNTGSNGTGTFQITSQTVAGPAYTGPTIAVNSTIQCS
jgi:hypothetical protein